MNVPGIKVWLLPQGSGLVPQNFELSDEDLVSRTVDDQGLTYEFKNYQPRTRVFIPMHRIAKIEYYLYYRD